MIEVRGRGCRVVFDPSPEDDGEGNYFFNIAFEFETTIHRSSYLFRNVKIAGKELRRFQDGLDPNGLNELSHVNDEVLFTLKPVDNYIEVVINPTRQPATPEYNRITMTMYMDRNLVGYMQQEFSMFPSWW